MIQKLMICFLLLSSSAIQSSTGKDDPSTYGYYQIADSPDIIRASSAGHAWCLFCLKKMFEELRQHVNQHNPDIKNISLRAPSKRIKQVKSAFKKLRISPLFKDLKDLSPDEAKKFNPETYDKAQTIFLNRISPDWLEQILLLQDKRIKWSFFRDDVRTINLKKTLSFLDHKMCLSFDNYPFNQSMYRGCALLVYLIHTIQWRFVDMEFFNNQGYRVKSHKLRFNYSPHTTEVSFLSETIYPGRFPAEMIDSSEETLKIHLQKAVQANFAKIEMQDVIKIGLPDDRYWNKIQQSLDSYNIQ